MAWQKRIEDISTPTLRRGRAPISRTHPDLTLEWYFQKNCGWGPEEFSAGSNVQAWWRCTENRKHVWQTAIVVRTRGSGCPFCGNKRVTAENSLATLYPKVAIDWHPTRNDDLTPDDVIAESGAMVWWQCRKCQHEWQQTIHNRTHNESGCFKCNRKIIDLHKGKYSFCLKFFDKKKNKGIDPSWLPNRTMVHWKCPKAKDHAWVGTIPWRRDAKSFCPFCRGSRLSKSVVAEIKKLYRQGVSQLEITRRLDLGKDRAHKVLKREGLLR